MTTTDWKGSRNGMLAVLLALALAPAGAAVAAGGTEAKSGSAEAVSQAERAGSPEAGEGAADPQEQAEGGEDEEARGEAAEPSLDDRLDALLAEVMAEDAYRETRRCLSRHAYRRVEVLNEEYLLFSKGSTHWLNKLKRSCRTLRFNDLPIFQQRGTSSLCEGDIFYPTNSLDVQRGLDSAGRPLVTHGTCYLGIFEQITAEQAALLREH